MQQRQLENEDQKESYRRIGDFITVSWYGFEKQIETGTIRLPTERDLREQFRRFEELPQTRRRVELTPLTIYAEQFRQLMIPSFTYDFEVPPTVYVPTKDIESVIHSGLQTAVAIFTFLTYRTGADADMIERAALKLSKTRLEDIAKTRARVAPSRYELFDNTGEVKSKFLVQRGYGRRVGCPASLKPTDLARKTLANEGIHPEKTVTSRMARLFVQGVHTSVLPVLEGLPQGRKGSLLWYEQKTIGRFRNT